MEGEPSVHATSKRSLDIKYYYFKDKSLVNIPVPPNGGEAGMAQIQTSIIKNSDFHNTFINYIKKITQGHLLVLLKSEENMFMIISGQVLAS